MGVFPTPGLFNKVTPGLMSLKLISVLFSVAKMDKKVYLILLLFVVPVFIKAPTLNSFPNAEIPFETKEPA